MKRFISHYDLKKYYLCRFIESDECVPIDASIQVIVFTNNHLVLNGQIIPLEQDESEFFQTLHTGDVIEILPSGIVNLLYSTIEEDNVLFITSKCNSNCIMCPSSEKSRILGEVPSLDRIKKLIQYYPEKLSHITITGGEPLLLGSGIGDVLAALKGKDNCAQYLFLTNGRAFCIPEILDSFVGNAPTNTIIAIPIHGHNEKLHDYITNTRGSFRQTVAGIQKLLNNGKLVEIRIVISQQNINYITEIADLIIKEFGSVFKVNFIGMEMSGNAAVNQNVLWVSYADVCTSIVPAINKLVHAGISCGIYNIPLCQIDSDYWSICEKSISPNKIVFGPECNECVYTQLCSGLFISSYKYISTELNPFREFIC